MIVKNSVKFYFVYNLFNVLNTLNILKLFKISEDEFKSAYTIATSLLNNSDPLLHWYKGSSINNLRNKQYFQYLKLFKIMIENEVNI
jgi:hypothetical protein